MSKFGLLCKGTGAFVAKIMKKGAKAIVAHKVRSLVIGGVAAALVGGTVATVAIVSQPHEHKY